VPEASPGAALAAPPGAGRNVLRPLFRTLSNTAIALGALGIALTVGLNLAQILARYVFFSPFAWTEEAMRYIMVWVTMLGAAATIYRGEEAAAGMLGWVPSRAVQLFLHGLRVLILLAFGGILAWYGFPFALSVGNQVSPAGQIPMVIPFLAFGVGGALILLMAAGSILAPYEADPDELRPADVS
jgi:C4-dicarboxylate transporter, DctQ subunit